MKSMIVGRIVAPHGIRGEVKVEVMTDFPERFAVGSELWLEGEEQPCRVLSARPYRGFLLIRLTGYPTRTEVEALRGRFLVIPREQARPLPEGEYYSDELEGLTVVTTTGFELGVLREVWWTGANEVYVTQGAFGEVLLPAIAEVVHEVDLQNRRLVVKLLPGLVPALDDSNAVD